MICVNENEIKEPIEETEVPSEQNAPGNESQQQATPYVERPRSHRILAWCLFVIMLIGIALWYYWIARG